MSGQIDGSTLPSPASPQPSVASSQTWSPPSPSIDHIGEPDSRTPIILDEHGPRAPNTDVQVDSDHLRKRQRRSGGFLLSSTSPASFGSARTTARGPESKGKGKVEDTGLAVPKRRSILNRHRLKQSIGSSPLAKEVVSDASAPDPQTKGAPGGDQALSVPSKTSLSIQSSIGSNSTYNGSSSKDTERSQEIKPVLDFDTDAARLVNIALSLSESRRRNFSGGLLAPPTSVGDRRILSAGEASAIAASSAGGGSLGYHLQQQRRTSKNISPGRDESGPQRSPSARHSQDSRSPTHTPIRPIIDLNGSPDLLFSPSDATLSRAEKARITLELGYEYRRLLQYLPKLPTRSKGRPTTTRLGRKENEAATNDLGRPYNPLQYVRNRKVRLRERRPLNPETDGWNSLVKVRNWVNIVAGEREAGISTIDERYPLPPFETDPTQPSTTGPSQLPDSSNPSGARPRRPRQEWTFMPSDLLADAYWLQHDGNIAHIEDSLGHKIVSSPQSYKAASARSSTELDYTSHRRSESINRHAISPEKFRSLVDKTRKDASRERNNQKAELSEPDTPTRSQEGPKDWKDRWPRRLVRSRSSSSSGESDHEIISNLIRHDRRGSDYTHSAALEKHMRNLLNQEDEEKDATASRLVEKSGKNDDGNDSRHEPNHKANGSVTHNRRSSTERMQETAKPKAPTNSAQPSARTSFEEQRGRERRRSSNDPLNATGSKPQKTHRTVPSIAIDVSRPNSPPQSTRKRSPSREGISPSRSKERQAISETDFAVNIKPLPHQSRNDDSDSNSKEEAHKVITNSLPDGFLSPITAEGFSRKFRRSDGSTTKSAKEGSESDSKLRGFFRGGRIAEIVGNEVSRVGDILRRKDASNPASPIVSPASSIWGESDTEDDTFGTSPETDLSRVATKVDGYDKAESQEPQYHMSNLPSFRSPFLSIKGQELIEKAPEQDTNQSKPLQQQERGRSSRFERLAPPKLDMRNVSPSASPPLTRTQTRNTVASYDPFDSRQSSTSRSESHVRDADRRLNAALGLPGAIGRAGPPMTGLATLEIRQRRSQERSATKDKRDWSIGHRSISAARGVVTSRDVARVRALLLSSGVKANEIIRRAHEIRETPSPLFLELQRVSKGPLPHVSRAEEHTLAANVCARTIDDSSQKIRDAAERFSNETLEDLHKQIKDIDEQVTHKLTPSVRAFADDADAFSTQLTTTHVLEVKQLNDSVDAILRRRRRRLRWIRRGGYVVLEWTLLGIMWWAWLIVAIIRLVRGTVKGLSTVIRWLLWL